MDKFDKILNDIRDGNPIGIVDEIDRENELDLMVCGEKADKSNTLFLMTKAYGLLCAPCSDEICHKLDLHMMTSNPTDPLGTPFTISVDAANGGTGVSLADKLKTIDILCNENSKPEDLRRPGHMFPLRAKPGLLQARLGHTEAAVQLCGEASVKQVCLIVEVMNEDGTMAKGQQVTDYARKYNINVISIPEIRNVIHGH